MFKVTADPKFTHPVTVFVPTNGGHTAQTFPVTFRVVPEDELPGGDGVEGQKETLRRLVVHMDDLVDDDEKPIPYSDAIRDQLINHAFVRMALMKTYIEAVTKVKAGN